MERRSARVLPIPFLLPALSAAPWLFACGGGAPSHEGVAVDASMAELVPADAALFLALPSLESLESTLTRMHADLPAMEPAQVLAQLEALAGVDLARLDRTRPIGLAARIDERRLEPLSVLLLPALDPAALAAEVPDAVVRGAYVAVPEPGSEYAPGGVPHALATISEGSDLDLRVDLARLVQIYRPGIDAGLADFEVLAAQMSDASMPVDAGAVFDGYLNMARAVLDSVDALRVSARLGRESWDVRAALSTRAGSPMAMLELGDPGGDVAALARHLDLDAPMVFLGNADFGELADDMETWLGAMLPGTGWFEDMRAVYEHCDGAFGGAFDLEEGIGVSMLYAADDGEALLRKQLEVMTSGAMTTMGMVAVDAGTEEIAGTEVQKVTLAVDPDAPDVSAEVRAQMSASLGAMFGEDELTYRFAAAEDRMLMLIGGGASSARALERFRDGGALPDDLRGVLAQLDDAQLGMAFRVDVAHLLVGLGSMFGGSRQVAPEAVRSASVPLTCTLAAQDGAWTLSLSVVPRDLAALDEVFEEF